MSLFKTEVASASAARHGIAVALFISAASVALAQSPADLKDHLDQVAAKEMTSQRGVGLIVGVIHNGDRSVLSYGESVKGSGRKPDSKTLFQIGSISKTFTAALLADLVRQGKAKLDDPLGKYLPRARVPAFGPRQITLLDLATHTSGLPRNLGRWQRDHATIQDLLAFMSSYRLTRAPGERYEYSNLAFAVLGHALAHSAKTNWAQMVNREIAAPLELFDTTVELTPEELSRRAQGYGPAGNPAPLHSNMWPAMAPAGGLYSTMEDMLNYLAFNMGERETQLNELLPILLQPRHAGPKPRTQVALGWEIGPAGNGNIIWKNGATPGFHSYIGFNPTTKIGVVVLSNSSLQPAVIAAAVFSYFRIAPNNAPLDTREDAEDDVDSTPD